MFIDFCIILNSFWSRIKSNSVIKSNKYRIIEFVLIPSTTSIQILVLLELSICLNVSYTLLFLTVSHNLQTLLYLVKSNLQVFSIPLLYSHFLHGTITKGIWICIDRCSVLNLPMIFFLKNQFRGRNSVSHIFPLSSS